MVDWYGLFPPPVGNGSSRGSRAAQVCNLSED